MAAVPFSGYDLLIPALALLVTGFAGWLTGQTARSKGYSFGLFFGLSFISWFIMATIAVFIKPRTGSASASVERIARSRILYFSGLASYVAGVISFVLAWGNESEAAVSGLILIGPALIMGSIVLLVSAVVQAKSDSTPPLADFEIS